MTRWTSTAANDWYAARPWPIGCNFVPSTAVNQLEMWQADTFDAVKIDRELGFAAGLGMNVVRIFLHNLLWRDDAQGLVKRLDAFLSLADRYGIATMPVLFESCWSPNPSSGPQPLPRPGVHNSRWVQSPGTKVFADLTTWPGLEAYTKGVIGAFAHDPRVFAWDIWNEPDNGPEVDLRDPAMLAAKGEQVLPLLTAAFGWASAAEPSQPLTSAVWSGDWSSMDGLTPIQRLQIARSDIVTFHNYDGADEFMRRVGWLRAYDRPIICTEYLARPRGSSFAAILPVAAAARVGLINWGLVRGRTQTNLPWDSWVEPYVGRPSGPWFHDILEPDGSAYDANEPPLLRAVAERMNHASLGNMP